MHKVSLYLHLFMLFSSLLYVYEFALCACGTSTLSGYLLQIYFIAAVT